MSRVKDEDNVLTTLKILIIGDSGVGKSSLLRRFSKDQFDIEQKATICVDHRHKIIPINGNLVKLIVCDASGSDRFRSVVRNYYRGVQGFILVYDVTDGESFARLECWLNELETFAKNEDIVKIVVGNKIDGKTREVSYHEGMQFAKQHNMLFIESSAKANTRVNCVFEELAEKIMTQENERRLNETRMKEVAEIAAVKGAENSERKKIEEEEVFEKSMEVMTKSHDEEQIFGDSVASPLRKKIEEEEVFEKAIKVMTKSHDEEQIFGDFVVSALRNIKIVSIRSNLKKKIRREIMLAMELEDNSNSTEESVLELPTNSTERS